MAECICGHGRDVMVLYKPIATTIYCSHVLKLTSSSCRRGSECVQILTLDIRMGMTSVTRFGGYKR